MVALRIAGTLDECATFPLPLDLARLADLRYVTRGLHWEWVWNFLALRDIEDPELEAAMAKHKNDNIAATAAKQVADHTNLMLASPEWRRLAPKLRNKFLKNFREADPGWYGEQVLGSIEEAKDETFDLLWTRRRKWLKQKWHEAEKLRRRRRLRSALRRLGIGTGKKTVL